MFKTNLSDIFSDLNTESSVILPKSIKIKNINSVDTIANTTSSFMPQKGGYSDATSSFMPQKGGYLNGTKNKHINQLISMLSATSESNYTTNSTDTEQLKNKLFNIIQSGGDYLFFVNYINKIINEPNFKIPEEDKSNYVKKYEELDQDERSQLRKHYKDKSKDKELSPDKIKDIKYFGLDFYLIIPPIISELTATSTPTSTSASRSTSRVKFPDILIASIAPNPDPDPAPDPAPTPIPTPTPIAPTPTPIAPIAPITPIVSTPIDPTVDISFFINIINDVFKDSNFTISNNDIKQYLIEYKKLNNASKKLLKEYSSTQQDIKQLTENQLKQINKFGLHFNLTEKEEKEMISILSFIYYIIKTKKFTIPEIDIIPILGNYKTLTDNDKAALDYILFFMNYINKIFDDTTFIIPNKMIREYLIRYKELTDHDKATLKTYYDTQLANLISRPKKGLTDNQLTQIRKFGLNFNLTDYQEKEMISILSFIYYINNIIETKKFTIPEIDIIPNLIKYKTLTSDDINTLDYILFFMNYINKIFNDKTFIIPGSEIEEYLKKYTSIKNINRDIRDFLRYYRKTKLQKIRIDRIQEKQMTMFDLDFMDKSTITIDFLNSILLFTKYIDDIFSDKYKQFKIPESEIEKYKETHGSLSDDTKEFLHRYYNKYKPNMLNEEKQSLVSTYGLSFDTGTKPTIMSPPPEEIKIEKVNIKYYEGIHDNGNIISDSSTGKEITRARVILTWDIPVGFNIDNIKYFEIKIYKRVEPHKYSDPETFSLFQYSTKTRYYYLKVDRSDPSKYYKILDGKPQYFAVISNLQEKGVFYFTVKIISDIANKKYVDSEPSSTLMIYTDH